jgi:hypothetical protein
MIVIQESVQNCVRPTNRQELKLCSTECDLGSASFRKLVSNRAVCPNGNVFLLEGGTGATIEQMCSSSSNTGCIKGTFDEKSTCGYLNLDIAKLQCVNQSDSCCISLLANIKSDETNRVVIIASSVAGGVLFLTLAVLALYCIRKRKLQTNSPAGFIVHRAEQVSRPSDDAGFKNTKFQRSNSQNTDTELAPNVSKDYFGLESTFPSTNPQQVSYNATFTLQPVSPVITMAPPQASLLQSVQETKHLNSAPPTQLVHSLPNATPLSALLLKESKKVLIRIIDQRKSKY